MTDATTRMAKAAGLLIITVMISRILGYGREVAIYSLFGQNYTTDAYRAAFSIPDFIYMLLVGGALSAAIIPVFSGFIARDRVEEAWKSVSIVFNYMLIFLILATFLAYTYTEPLINLLAPGLPTEYSCLAVDLTHIMFWQTFFMVLNGFSMGILNSHNHFAAPAIGSLFYNLVIIIMGISFVNQLGIAAFSYAVVLGAAFNFAVQVPALSRLGLKYYFSFDFRDEGFRQVIILLLPVLAGLGVVQLNLFVTQNLSSGLGAGTLSSLNLAQKIMNLPMGIFAVSIATAIFPSLTAYTALGEMDKFKRTSSLGIRSILLLGIPSSFGLIAIGEPLISLLFQQGEFSSANVRTTYQFLVYYCIGLFAYSAVQIINRSFYALKDTLTPVIAAVLTIGFNIFLSIKLIAPMGAEGLALAYSLAGFLNLVLLMLVLRVKVGRIGGSRIIAGFCIAMGASVIMFFVVRFITGYLMNILLFAGKIKLLLAVSAGFGSGVLVYGIIVYLFSLEESKLLMEMLGKK